MKFSQPLIKATLVKRYKRFLADCILEDGTEVTAHCPNTGSMKTCCVPGCTVYLSYSPSPKRKLAYSWEFSELNKGEMIGVHTGRPNKIVEEAFVEKKVPGFEKYEHVRREVKWGSSRFDLKLEGGEGLPDVWIEIKNVTLLDGDSITFPDAVTVRGTKHLKELQELKKEPSTRCIMFYLINRPDGNNFKTAKDIDPTYAKELILAAENGVEILSYRAKATLEEVVLGDLIPFVME